MTRKTTFILLFSFFSLYLSAQNEVISPADSATFNVLDHRFIGGKMAFFKFLGENIIYPVEAREHCRQGVSLVRVKLRPTGVVDSIQFQNAIAIGMGIEEEILRCLLGTKGKWLRSADYPELLFSIGFSLDEKEQSQATIVIAGSGMPQNLNCPTEKSIIEAFQKAKKKKNYKEALELCQDLLRRMPNSETYKKEFAFLKTKAN
jgi:hypothetical protein